LKKLNSFHGHFGHKHGYDGVKDGLLLKEFRFWANERTDLEVKMYRSHQLDPTFKKNENLFHYLRLVSADNFAIQRNFARFNPNPKFNFKNRDKYLHIVKLYGYNFVSDFSVQKINTTATKVWENIYKTELVYHVVCPLHTYLVKNKCYREPFNRIDLAVFPKWND
jgi:hypothetical protein